MSSFHDQYADAHAAGSFRRREVNIPRFRDVTVRDRRQDVRIIDSTRRFRMEHEEAPDGRRTTVSSRRNMTLSGLSRPHVSG